MLVGDMRQLAPVPDVDPVLSEAGRSKRPRAAYLFESACFKAGNFVHMRLAYCWRYNLVGQLGKLLERIRVLPFADEQLATDLYNLVNKSSVNVADTVVLCCTKARARAWSLAKLQDMPGDEFQYYGIDRRGGGLTSNRCVAVMRHAMQSHHLI